MRSRKRTRTSGTAGRLRSDTTAARADTSVTQSWNAAYESWFSHGGGTAPDAAELMIWMDYQNMTPGGDYVESVTIGGRDWNLYHATGWGSWNHYIAYQLVTPVSDGTIDFDFADFVDDSLSRGWLDPSWYLDNMEAGFEIIRGGAGLTSESFSGAVAVPEPQAALMFLIGGAGLLLSRLRRR
jgi:hypothetical protein